MRKIFILAIILFTSNVAAVACDICGCGVGSYYMGLLPEFKKRFIGLRYQQRGLISHLSPTGSRTYLTTDEMSHTFELWGAWNVNPKWRVMAILPYSNIEKTNQGITRSKSGFGDASVTAYYNLISAETTIGEQPKRVVHSLWIGGGVKLPTGNYNAADKQNNNLQETNTYQLGTGSVDFTVNAMYDLRIQDAGINANVSYKMNATNKYEYRYGNKLTTNVLGYYKFRLFDKATIAPNAGVLYERSEIDLLNKLEVDASGGNILMGIGGVEFNINRIGVGANYQTPLHQQLGNGLVKAKDRLMVHLSLAF